MRRLGSVPELFSRDWDQLIPDASVLIGLASAGALELISAIPGKIVVPQVVVLEATWREDRAEAQAIREWLTRNAGRIEVFQSEEAAILSLALDRGLTPTKGLGDNAVVALMVELAMRNSKSRLLVLVNDRDLIDRVMAIDRSTIAMTGTALVREAERHGLIQSADEIIRTIERRSGQLARRGITVARSPRRPRR